jgi:hypothetical protein
MVDAVTEESRQKWQIIISLKYICQAIEQA